MPRDTRYDDIAASEWFREAYEGRSLGETLRVEGETTMTDEKKPTLDELEQTVEDAWEAYRKSGHPDSDPEVYLSRFNHSVNNWLAARKQAKRRVRAYFDDGQLCVCVPKEAMTEEWHILTVSVDADERVKDLETRLEQVRWWQAYFEDSLRDHSTTVEWKALIERMTGHLTEALNGKYGINGPT